MCNRALIDICKNQETLLILIANKWPCDYVPMHCNVPYTSKMGINPTMCLYGAANERLVPGLAQISCLLLCTWTLWLINISVLHTWKGIWYPHTLWLVCFSSSCSILCWKLSTKEMSFHTEKRKSREINQFSKVLFLVLPNCSSPPLYWWWVSVWCIWRSPRT